MGSVTTTNICKCCGDCITATLKCSTRSGSAFVGGYPEYVSPSTPVKRYRKRALSGDITGRTYSDSGCSNFVCSTTDTDSGSCDYDALTLALVVNGVSVRTQVNSCGGTGSTAGCSFGSFAAGGDTDVYTQIQRTVTNDMVCRTFDGGASYFNRNSQPTRKELLSVEDTDSDAIVRFRNATSYGAFAVCTAPSCCTAKWEQRTTSITFGYADAQWRVFQTSLTAGQLYYAHVPIYRRPYGTSPTWTLYQTLVTSGTTSVTGVLSIDGQVPNDVGFESYADQPCVVVPKH